VSELTLVVLSDIHAHDHTDDTYVDLAPATASRTLHPLVDLVEHIQDNAIRADYLILPGDLANKAHSGGLAYVWQQARHVARLLGAEIVAVPGNHDVITHDAAPDPRGPLKALMPTFPTQDPAADEEFWATGWLVIERADHRFLLIDSTYDFPDFPTDPTDPAVWSEYASALNRGGFSEHQEQGIESYLRGANRKLNIAVVHHHPMEHQLRHQFQDTYGPMRRGGELVDLLTRHRGAGRWLVIHGHKHVPQLASAVATSANGPVMLCAASVGAQIWPPLNTVARNQFHLVRVRDDNPGGLGYLLGQVQSAMWCIGEGWLPPPPRGAGLPRLTGFGCIVDHRNLAARCRDEIERKGADFMEMSELVQRVPELQYIAPRDFEHLETEIASLMLEFTRSRDEEIRLLAKRA